MNSKTTWRRASLEQAADIIKSEMGSEESKYIISILDHSYRIFRKKDRLKNDNYEMTHHYRVCPECGGTGIAEYDEVKTGVYSGGPYVDIYSQDGACQSCDGEGRIMIDDPSMIEHYEELCDTYGTPDLQISPPSSP